jgi:hypothetical protein
MVLLALVGSTALAVPAVADPAQAKEHFDRALAHVDRREYRKAVAEFRQAYESQPHFSVLFNLGQAHVLLDEPVEAIESLGRYLEQGGTSVPTERVEEVQSTLDQQRKLVGELVVQASPLGAAIAVDGRPAGVTPLSRPLILRTGRHLVKASLSGFRPAEQWVDVIHGHASVVDLTLPQPEPPPHPTLVSGQLEVGCAIVGVSVHIDGSPRAETPLRVTLLVEPGPRQISFERPGYRFSSRTVTLRAGETSRVECRGSLIQPLPDKLAARLTVRTTPVDHARVVVDGIPAAAEMRLPAGPHRVVVSRAGYEPWSRNVHLSAAQTLEIHAQLVPEASYLEQRQTHSTTQRVVAYVLGGAGIVLTAVTVGHFVWNDGRHGDWSDEDDELQKQWSGELARATDLEERQTANDELLRSVLRGDSVTVGLGVGAGALLIAGTALFFAGDDPGDFEVSAEPHSSGATVRIGGTW